MPANPAWKNAFGAAVAFRRRPHKADELVARWQALESDTRRRAFHLFYAWLRWRGWAEAGLREFLRKPPRMELQTLLELACAEMAMIDRERRPLVVNHAVDVARALLSPREAGLVNAVLRRAAGTLDPGDLGATHPAWLVARWEAEHGPAATRELLAWNQREASTYVRWASQTEPPAGLRPTPWEGFFELTPEAREAVLGVVERGEAYIQDPFTRHPVELAMRARPRHVLDLCAAPGGKSRALLDAASAGEGALETLVAVDLPGPRLARLEENLAPVHPRLRLEILGADVAALRPADLAAHGLPAAYDAVILDVPCSNTGVIRRRPDVRWLLSPLQLEELAALQGRLLAQAAHFVAPGGTLVYSTCSLERAENEAVVEWFLTHHPEFSAGAPKLSRPWVEGHDGGAAFPLTRLGGA